MKSMKIRTLVSLCMMALCLALPALVFAQGGPGDPGGDPDPGVPFDGGLSLLVAAGIGYAAKKGYDKRKKLKADVQEEKTIQ